MANPAASSNTDPATPTAMADGRRAAALLRNGTGTVQEARRSASCVQYSEYHLMVQARRVLYHLMVQERRVHQILEIRKHPRFFATTQYNEMNIRSVDCWFRGQTQDLRHSQPGQA